MRSQPASQMKLECIGGSAMVSRVTWFALQNISHIKGSFCAQPHLHIRMSILGCAESAWIWKCTTHWCMTSALLCRLLVTSYTFIWITSQICRPWCHCESDWSMWYCSVTTCNGTCNPICNHSNASTAHAQLGITNSAQPFYIFLYR